MTKIYFYVRFNSKEAYATNKQELKAILDDFINNISCVRRSTIAITPRPADEKLAIVSIDTFLKAQKRLKKEGFNNERNRNFRKKQQKRR